ncbi:MAG: PH domain-containing protein [Gemmatimonadota bacterium]
MDDPRSITQPDPALRRYYLITSLLGGPFFPFIYLPLWFKYRTLRYRFDDDGVSMSWGRFFHRETYLTYRRIQDIQVSRGVIQRRLGLADLQLQTASGGSGAEMKIEGVRNPDRLRDFLYERMRGARDDGPGKVPGEVPGEAPGEAPEAAHTAAPPQEALHLLREIRDELRRVNAAGTSGADHGE